MFLGLGEYFVDFALSRFGLPKRSAHNTARTSTAAMATLSPLLIPYGRRAPLVTPPRSLLLPSDAAKLPDGAIPASARTTSGRRTQATAASWRRSSATYATRCAARTGAEAAAAANKAVARDLASTVHGATRRERERRAAAARTPPRRGPLGPRARCGALGVEASEDAGAVVWVVKWGLLFCAPSDEFVRGPQDARFWGPNWAGAARAAIDGAQDGRQL